MNIIKRLCTLWVIAEEYEKTENAIANAIERLRKKINERTTVHADIHMKSPSLVIVVGEYKGCDYVRAFEVPHDSLYGLIDHLKRIEPHARVGRMDMLPHFRFSSVYPHERF